MGFAELTVLAVGLAADAFSVSVCKGLASKKTGARHMLTAGLWFGMFQAAMPMLGYLLGSGFRIYIEKIDHWIAFALLVAIGLNMIREALFGKDEGMSASYSAKVMLLLAVATSIDALAVGVMFGLLFGTFRQAALASLYIGCVTFVLSALGIKVGGAAGSKFGKYAQVAGGLILSLIGVKILLEHLGLIPF